MPLTLTATADSPEVAALKAKVVEVAMRYAKQHNWCSVVKRALAEAGITSAEKVKVEITFSVSGSTPTKAEKTFAVAELAGKSEADQNAYVAEKIAPKVEVAGTEVTLPVVVTDLTQVGDIIGGPQEPGSDAPNGWRWMYSSDDGRVRHLWPVLTDDRHRTYVSTYCGREGRVGNLTENATRGEGRNCTDCVRRAGMYS